MKQSKIKNHIKTKNSKRNTKRQKINKKGNTKPYNKLKINHKGGDPNVDIMPYLKPYGILDPEGKYPNPLTGYEYSDLYYKFSRGDGLEEGKKPWSQMPVYNDRKVFFNKLHQNSVMLLTSDTGSGKTVVVPKLLLHYFDYNCQIVVTIPKRGIVANAAGFAATTLDVRLGEHVGYVHGNEKNKYNPKHTNLIYMTEGILLAQMTGSDPDLTKYSGVVIDEAHERSTNVDILLMLLKKLALRRPDFKLVIMSATVSEKTFIDYYNVPGIKFTTFRPNVPGTLFKINHQFQNNHINKTDSIEELTKQMKHIVSKTKGGHVIAFVSTKSEADKLCRDLKDELDESDQKPLCLPFYSGAKKSADIVKKSNDGELEKLGYGRLILPATNAVESSITVDGTEYVLDTGLEFRVFFDPEKVAYIRGKTYSTQAQIKQRCGRTGRTNAGYCIRIYSKPQWNHFEEFPIPEIQTENFTSQLLDIVGMKLTGNLTNGLAMIQEMIEPPKKPYLKHAINNLYYLGLMYKDGNLTSVGKAVRKFNKISPELALMVLASTAFKCTYEVIVIAAMMSLGGLDDWVSEPDDKNRYRKKSDYMADMRRWSNEFYNYGDHFVLLAIYMECDSAKNKDKWCREHGVNSGYMSMLETIYKGNRPTKMGVIDEIFKTLEGLTYYPEIFDEPEKEPITDIKSGYRSLTQINDNRNYKSSSHSRSYDNKYKSRTRSKYYSRQNGGFSRNFKQKGGRPKKKGNNKQAKKAPKVDKQKLERDNKNDFAKNVFKKYYMPVDGTLPRKPSVSYIEDEILSCIYYAFHRNTGVYMGSGGKKYKSKITPVDGSMKGSIYDVVPELQPPDICIYHTLDIMESEYGKEASSYKTICAIDEDLMVEFM